MKTKLEDVYLILSIPLFIISTILYYMYELDYWLIFMVAGNSLYGASAGIRTYKKHIEK